jgi:hypothetical protein
MYNMTIGINGLQQYCGHIEIPAKRLTKHMPFRLVYGKEVVMPLEFVVPSLRIAVVTQMSNDNHYKDGWMSYWNWKRTD